MTSVTELRELVDVVIGVDTHVATHSAAVIDARTGAVLEQATVAATAEGYQLLTDFADQHSPLRAWAIEGTGSHGAGLTRHLSSREELIIELDRPVRAKRRNGAKSDALDAVRAAREALARTRLGQPRGNGEHSQDRHSLAILLTARRSAVQAAGDAQRQLFSLVITAPEHLRARFRGQRGPAMVTTAVALRTHPRHDIETTTVITTLRALARRIRALTDEAAAHEQALLAILRSWRADLLAQPGVGPIVAATVLCAWSHPGRFHNEAAFAMLAGVAPIPANSGQVTTPYRLNRRGDRQLNRALHTIALSRAQHHQPTRDYIARRTTDGKTPREIRRCLKRYIARDLYRLLQAGPPTLDNP